MIQKVIFFDNLGLQTSTVQYSIYRDNHVDTWAAYRAPTVRVPRRHRVSTESTETRVPARDQCDASAWCDCCHVPSSSSAAAAVPAAGGGYSPSSSSVSRMSSLIWKSSVYAPRLWLMVCRNCIFTVRWVRRRWDAVARCLSIRFSVRLSVCPSVTRRYFIKTVKYILKHLSHQRVATPFYFFQTKQYGNIPTRIPHGGSNSGGG